MKLIEPPTGCDHRESLRPGAFYYCNKPVQFFTLSAAKSQAGPEGVSLAGFCGLQHANVEPKPTLDAARQFHDRMLAEGCPCGNCDAARRRGADGRADRLLPIPGSRCRLGVDRTGADRGRDGRVHRHGGQQGRRGGPRS